MSQVDDLITTCRHLVKFLRQSASYARSFQVGSLATSLDRAALGLERAIGEALAAPPDESLPREQSFIDTALEYMSAPGNDIPRIQIVWLLLMHRRARALVRRYLGAAEITEPAEEIAKGQRWLDEIDEGPN